MSGFMHKYYDWASFEVFVKELYEGDGEVTVQRDVTEVDRYGARRQTDVKIVRRSRFHKFTTLVECKRWKEPVGRDRIDVLASSIEALNANNGAIFTTSGFEEGAIAYAKGKGIDLFVVRDLTPEEWGLPGRHISFYLHVNAAEFTEIGFAAQAVMLIDDTPGEKKIDLALNPDYATDPDHDLFSVKTGERGMNLVGILGDAHGIILSEIAKSVGLFEGGKDLTYEINARCEVDLTATPFHQLRLPECAVRIERIGFKLRAHISQSEIAVDRGANLDFAVMVESYVSDERLLAHRRKGDAGIVFAEARSAAGKPDEDSMPLKNGSLMNVQFSPWTGLGEKKADRVGVTSQLLRVIVETEGKKPRLSFVSVPPAGTSVTQ